MKAGQVSPATAPWALESTSMNMPGALSRPTPQKFDWPGVSSTPLAGAPGVPWPPPWSAATSTGMWLSSKVESVCW